MHVTFPVWNTREDQNVENGPTIKKSNSTSLLHPFTERLRTPSHQSPRKNQNEIKGRASQTIRDLGCTAASISGHMKPRRGHYPCKRMPENHTLQHPQAPIDAQADLKPDEADTPVPEASNINLDPDLMTCGGVLDA
jgi:hypothetical protein